MKTTVANFRDVKQHWDKRSRRWDDECYVYIGRSNGTYNLPQSPFANPFPITKTINRASVIRSYEEWLLSHPVLMRRLPSLKDKILICWCSPLACHGDVLVRLLEGTDDDPAAV